MDDKRVVASKFTGHDRHFLVVVEHAVDDVGVIFVEQLRKSTSHGLHPDSTDRCHLQTFVKGLFRDARSLFTIDGNCQVDVLAQRVQVRELGHLKLGSNGDNAPPLVGARHGNPIRGSTMYFAVGSSLAVRRI